MQHIARIREHLPNRGQLSKVSRRAHRGLGMANSGLWNGAFDRRPGLAPKHRCGTRRDSPRPCRLTRCMMVRKREPNMVRQFATVVLAAAVLMAPVNGR